MQLAYAFPADAAQFAPDGKLSVIGGDIDTIWAVQFPVLHPALVLVVKLVAQPLECGLPHRLRVALVDADYKPLYEELVLPFTLQENTNHPGRVAGIGLTLNYQGLVFPAAGDYAFYILVDDLQMGFAPLYLRVRPAPQKSEAGSETERA